jgi:hypothetical protein
MQILGTIAAAFAVMLLVLPTVRVLQGGLAPRMATGLWISGAGFLLLAAAALVLDGEDAASVTLIGIGLAVAGNIIQRRRTKG